MMKFYVQVQGTNGMISPVTITAADGDDAVNRVLPRFPGGRVSFVAPATPWDVNAALLASAQDLDPPAKAKAQA